MAEVMYNVAKARVAAGDLAFDTADIRAVPIVTSTTGASNPDLGTLAAIDAVGTVTFHTERIALSALTVTQDNINDRVRIAAGDFSFAPAAGVLALALLIYDNAAGANDGLRFPIAYYDTGFGAGVPMDGGMDVSLSGDYMRLS